jgi:hypothetical protein
MWIICGVAGGGIRSTVDPQGSQRKNAGNTRVCPLRKLLQQVDFQGFSTENALLYYYYSYKNT